MSPAASTITSVQPARTCFPPTVPAAVRNSYMAAFLPITPATTEQEKHQVCMLSVYCWCLYKSTAAACGLMLQPA